MMQKTYLCSNCNTVSKLNFEAIINSDPRITCVIMTTAICSTCYKFADEVHELLAEPVQRLNQLGFKVEQSSMGREVNGFIGMPFIDFDSEAIGYARLSSILSKINNPVWKREYNTLLVSDKTAKNIESNKAMYIDELNKVIDTIEVELMLLK